MSAAIALVYLESKIQQWQEHCEVVACSQARGIVLICHYLKSSKKTAPWEEKSLKDGNR